MMQGLDLTYATLGKSRNEAALDVLVVALADESPRNRGRGLSALMDRDEPRAPRLLLEHWYKLQAEEIAVVAARKTWISGAIEQTLGGDADLVLVAIEAAESIGLASALPKLVSLAESASSSTLRLRACDCVGRLAAPLGADARAERDQTTVRHPAATRLADSVRRFSMHRNERLIEAFLVCSSWSDSELRQLLGADGPESQLICKQLLESSHPSILELLVGFLRRRQVNRRVSNILCARSDDLFRDTLLRCIGSDPTPVVLKNLREMELPACCQGGEALFATLPPECGAALVHVYAACNPDYVETLHLIAAAVESEQGDCLSASTLALSRCEVPNPASWMRAALHLAADDPLACGDETARLLERLIPLLDHSDAALVRSLRRVLSALHASEMLSCFETLRKRSRRRLGRVVNKIDSTAIDRVRDALRHPVLTRRLEAIAMADALGLVDQLHDSFARIAREDHQEARMRAAEAMAGASNKESLALLHEMIELPECPVRDTAILAIQQRQATGRRQADPATETHPC